MPKASMAKPPPWTILALVKWTTGYFQDHQIESARSEAEILLAHSLDLRRIDLGMISFFPFRFVESGPIEQLIFHVIFV